MNYKPKSAVADLIMDDVRARGMTPQKVIENIILYYYKNLHESVMDGEIDDKTREKGVKNRLENP
jgi:hypothetical protein